MRVSVGAILCIIMRMQQNLRLSSAKHLRWLQNAGKRISEHSFCKNFLGEHAPTPPRYGWAADTAAAYGGHVGSTHKLGNPLPQILDPPLVLPNFVFSDFLIEAMEDVLPVNLVVSAWKCRLWPSRSKS